MPSKKHNFMLKNDQGNKIFYKVNVIQKEKHSKIRILIG